MPYNKTNWKDLPDVTTPINATRLNKLETQHEQAVADSKVYTDQAVLAALPVPQAVEAARQAELARDAAEGWRDQAETFAADTVELQDAAVAATASDESSATRAVLDNQYTNKHAFRTIRNSDGAVNAVLATALTYVNRPIFKYGNYNTLFNPDSSLQEGKYEIDCSSFVMACLQGITFENSKYLNAENFPSRTAFEFPAEYESPSQHRYLANDLALYAYENGWLYDLTDETDYERILPGDVLFFSNNGQWVENWRAIGHVSIVTKVIQNGGGWIESIDADIRGNVVSTVINSVSGLQGRKASCVARFPLQYLSAAPTRVSGGTHNVVESSGYTIRPVVTAENLLENTMYTLFFRADIPAGRFPVLSIGPTVIDSLTPTVKRRPDGLFRTSFFIPEGTIAAQPGQERRIVIGFGGSSPYPSAESDFAALYKGFLTDIPTHEDLTQYEEGVFTPTLRGTSVEGTPVYEARVGRWVSIGNLVTYTLTVTVTSLGGLEGGVEIGGLPFPVRPVSGLQFAASVSQHGVTPAPTMPEIIAAVFPTSSKVVFLNGGPTGRANMQEDQLAEATSITVTGSYMK